MTVKSKEFFPVINEILANNQSARITIIGNSMYPFLREYHDSVELSSVDFKVVRKGDIVLVLRDSGEYVLHRVIKKQEDSFYIAGDSQISIEGPIRPNQLLAKVKKVWRYNKEIKCSGIVWRLISRLWLFCYPFRYVLIRTYNYLR